MWNRGNRGITYGVYIPQLIRFANVCLIGSDFNDRNQYLTAKFLIQGNQYHRLKYFLKSTVDC